MKMGFWYIPGAFVEANLPPPPPPPPPPPAERENANFCSNLHAHYNPEKIINIGVYFFLKMRKSGRDGTNKNPNVLLCGLNFWDGFAVVSRYVLVSKNEISPDIIWYIIIIIGSKMIFSL